MRFSDNAMCAILLCSYLGIRSDDAIKPFSLGEWNEFLDKVIEMKEEPCAILRKDFDIANQMKYTDAYAERIRNLVSRGAGVAFELDDLEKKGIQVITLFDADYPILLRRKLKKKMPPVLFYAGDIKLSKKVGIAVVGSRNVNQEGIEFTKKLVEKAAGEKLVIYSGKGNMSEPFANALTACWNEAFGTQMECGNYDTIYSGFRTSIFGIPFGK